MHTTVVLLLTAIIALCAFFTLFMLLSHWSQERHEKAMKDQYEGRIKNLELFSVKNVKEQIDAMKASFEDKLSQKDRDLEKGELLIQQAEKKAGQSEELRQQLEQSKKTVQKLRDEKHALNKDLEDIQQASLVAQGLGASGVAFFGPDTELSSPFPSIIVQDATGKYKISVPSFDSPHENYVQGRFILDTRKREITRIEDDKK